MTLADQRHVLFQHVLGAGHVLGLAFQFQRIVDQVGVDPESGFNQTDVLVPGAKKAFDTATDLDACSHLFWWLFTSLKNSGSNGSNMVRGVVKQTVEAESRTSGSVWNHLP